MPVGGWFRARGTLSSVDGSVGGPKVRRYDGNVNINIGFRE